VETTADQVIQYAHDTDIDLIVMATHGYGLLKRFWLGSVADAVVRRSRVATLLIRPRADRPADLAEQPKYRNVLIPLDGSIAAETIVDHALALGGTEAEYTLIQALPVLTVVAPEFAMAGAPMDGEIRRAREQGAQAMLDTMAERIRLRDDRFKVHTALLTDTFAAGGILDYAQRNRCDLIAMTTHGHGGAVRLMLGSVADKVVRGAQVPVLLYRPA
jgi:nucleotide-binding universal stress UspA family protein